MDKEILGVDIRHLNLFRQRLTTLSREEQFKKIASMFLGASYKLGSENFNECDCSGLICSSLRGMGYPVRITAHEILTTLCDESDYDYIDKVKLVGFFDRKVKKYTHVGIMFHSPSEKLILHSSYPTGCAFEDLSDCLVRYQNKGYRIDYFTLNWSKVEKMEGKVYGLDEDFR